MKIEELSIEEKVGQMIMIGMDTPNAIDKIDDLILKYKIGGVLLYKNNYKNYGELLELVNYIKKINSTNRIPIFIAIDQEGGRVNRMPEDFEKLPSAYKLAQFSDKQKEDLVKESGKITGEMLNRIGINMNFAPVLDIKRFNDKHAIGDRAYSNNIDIISKYGIEYMKELQNKNVISVIKHFPGHGATCKDSHFILPIIKNKMSELEKEDMIPFERAIVEGADAMLIGHLLIKGETQRMPASMSRRFITKYIRKKYHYKGLIITDDMRMRGVKILYGKNNPVKKAFYAGNDIILMKYGEDEKLIDTIVKEIKKSPLKEARVNKSVRRILKTKEKYYISDKEIEADYESNKNINNKIREIKTKIERKEKDEHE